LGAPRSGPAATCALTTTPVLAALVLHTQITKLAVVPASTSDAAETDCVRTHNCGVIWPAGGDVVDALGVGDGLAGVLALVLGSGLGLGEEVGGGEDELSVGDGEGVSVGDGVEVSVGDGVEVSVGDGVEVSLLDSVGVSVGDAVEVSVGDAVGVSAGDRAAEPELD
jgi:hypothetical protein